MGGVGTVNGIRKIRLQWILAVISIVVLVIGIKNSILVINLGRDVINSLRFVDELDGNKLSFSIWEASNEDCYYIVLPSAYQSKNFCVELNYGDKFYSIYIDEEEYKSGAVWEDRLEEEVHHIKVIDCLGKVRIDKPFQILVSEEVPAIFVTVESKD